MAEVTEDKYLSELKDYLHVTTNDDDNNLQTMMDIAHATLISWCGQFGLENEVGKGLVFDYVRYRRAGASNYFLDNFRTQINSFGMTLMPTPTEDVVDDG